jgi:hypothetical protein
MAFLEDGKLEGPSTEACRHAVILRDLLREHGLAPGDDPGNHDDALPPPLRRARGGRPAKIRPHALRVLP